MILLSLLNSFCSCIVFLVLLNICLYVFTIHWISLKGLFWVLWHFIDILYFLLVAQSVWLFATPWTVACQAPLSMEFSRQEFCSGFPFPSPGDLLHLEIKPHPPELQVDSLPSEPPGISFTLVSVMVLYFHDFSCFFLSYPSIGISAFGYAVSSSLDFRRLLW